MWNRRHAGLALGRRYLILLGIPLPYVFRDYLRSVMGLRTPRESASHPDLVQGRAPASPRRVTVGGFRRYAPRPHATALHRSFLGSPPLYRDFFLEYESPRRRRLLATSIGALSSEASRACGKDRVIRRSRCSVTVKFRPPQILPFPGGPTSPLPPAGTPRLGGTRRTRNEPYRVLGCELESGGVRLLDAVRCELGRAFGESSRWHPLEACCSWTRRIDARIRSCLHPSRTVESYPPARVQFSRRVILVEVSAPPTTSRLRPTMERLVRVPARVPAHR
jgi:hypothetical protein